MKTKKELQDERARLHDIIDDVIKTAKEANRAFTDDERKIHDDAVLALEGEDGKGGIVADIARCETEEADAARVAGHEVRRARYDVPNVNTRGNDSVGAGVTRNLDALLWATDETVRATNGRIDNEVEQVIVRSDPSDAGFAAPRITEFRPADRDAIRSFQSVVAEMCLVGMMVDKNANTSRLGFQVARSLRQYKDRWTQICRALDVDTAGEGLEWVPTGIGASLHERVRASGKVAALFPRINLPTNPWKWPLEGADATAYRVPEPTSDNESKMTASTPGTVAATFDAEIFGARTLWSRSLDADSAIAIEPYVRMKLIQAFVDAEERAILDGDTDGTHQDSDVGASTTDARTAWDGLRKRAIAQTVVTATTTTAANLALLRGGMGRWGVNPSRLAFIIGLSAYTDLLADTSLLTIDKVGPQATILNGQIGSVHGVPVIVSEWVREDLNASGVYDGITTTKTYNLAVNRDEWAIGQRMALDVEVDDSIYRETFQRVAVAFMREDFQSLAGVATNDDTAISYNVTP